MKISKFNKIFLVGLFLVLSYFLYKNFGLNQSPKISNNAKIGSNEVCTGVKRESYCQYIDDLPGEFGISLCDFNYHNSYGKNYPLVIYPKKSSEQNLHAKSIQINVEYYDTSDFDLKNYSISSMSPATLTYHTKSSFRSSTDYSNISWEVSINNDKQFSIYFKADNTNIWNKVVINGSDIISKCSVSTSNLEPTIVVPIYRHTKTRLEKVDDSRLPNQVRFLKEANFNDLEYLMIDTYMNLENNEKYYYLSGKIVGPLSNIGYLGNTEDLVLSNIKMYLRNNNIKFDESDYKNQINLVSENYIDQLKLEIPKEEYKDKITFYITKYNDKRTDYEVMFSVWGKGKFSPFGDD